MAAAATTIATKPSALHTPLSATYPSELRSPLIGTPTFIKREDDMKTPITPPTAYVDFLKALSPTLMSPLVTSSSQKFPVNEGERAEKRKASDASSEAAPERSKTSTPENAAAPLSPPQTGPATSHPPLSRNLSTESTDSVATSATTSSAASTTSAASTASAPTPMQSNTSRARSNTSISTSRPEVPHPIQIPPPSAGPYSRPASARRTPRGTSLHMHIPGVSSPYTPTVPSPLSAGARSTRSIQSPFGSTMSPYSTTMSPYTTSAGPWSANAMSPRDRENVGQIASPVTGGGSSRVSVRQVVTRTVTYSRTPLDPAPKGKRRRVEDEGDGQ
ncbi:MAG: hypothetical protein M1821_006422 [Bathelium mastoideum]|nr:MAG: hypothetical protein M1821_006422 [Bathelium mastoideum]KAI9693699.1 MAG: hypothetical protein M1822_002970 [Bathelium mastoideum]